MNRFALLFCLGVAALSAAATPPNLVWIVADDMSPDIAAYGTPGVRTTRSTRR